MSAASSAAGRPRLTILTPPLQGRSFILTGQTATIGRNPECEIILDQPSISRQHARIAEENGRFVLRDLDSRNGITVAGQSVRESLLQNGDLFTVGDIQFRFEILGLPQAAAAPARVTPAIPAGWQPVAPAQGAAGPGAGGAAGTASGGPAKVNVKLLLAAAAGLVLAVVISVLIFRAKAETGGGVAKLPAILLKVGENRWVATRRDRPIALIEAVPDQVVEVSTQDLDDGEFIITGVSGGEADVRITKSDGSVGVMRALVRGRIENSLDDLVYSPISEEERRARAHFFVESALALQKDNPYLALQQFERALALLSNLPRGQDFIRAKAGQESARKIVETKWEKLTGDIRVAVNNNDFQRQTQLLEEALKLIPDENDWRYQKARSYLQESILRQMAKKK